MSGIEVYEIDFIVLEDENPRTLVILDHSNYLDEPEKPIYSIKLPGYNKSVVVPYEINSINILNSNLLEITDATCNSDLVDLQDGIYEITQAVCPYNELFATKLYLKTDKLDCRYDNLLLALDINCDCMPESNILSELMSIDILIRSAKAEAKRGNRFKAQSKYECALNKMNSLNDKLNCK